MDFNLLNKSVGKNTIQAKNPDTWQEGSQQSRFLANFVYRYAQGLAYAYLSLLILAFDPVVNSVQSCNHPSVTLFLKNLLMSCNSFKNLPGSAQACPAQPSQTNMRCLQAFSDTASTNERPPGARHANLDQSETSWCAECCRIHRNAAQPACRKDQDVVDGGR